VCVSLNICVYLSVCVCLLVHVCLSVCECVPLCSYTSMKLKNGTRKNEEAEPKQKNAQLWMCLVVKVRSDVVKSNIA